MDECDGQVVVQLDPTQTGQEGQVAEDRRRALSSRFCNWEVYVTAPFTWSGKPRGSEN